MLLMLRPEKQNSLIRAYNDVNGNTVDNPLEAQFRAENHNFLDRY